MAHSFRAALFVVLPLAGGVALPAAADDAAPAIPVAAPVGDPSPFAALVDRIRVGEPVNLGTATALALWVPRDARGFLPGNASSPAEGPRPWVGLAGTDARVLDLPAPIGDALVHVTNPLDAPLYLPRGEPLLPPFGLVRAIDRPVWLAPHAAAFVPVVQTAGPPAAGPYTASLDRLSPDSLRAMRVGSWTEFVAAQTLTLYQPGPASLDPLRGYAVGVYPKETTVPLAAIEAMRLAAPGPIVGLAFGDGVGLTTVILEADPARLRVQWPGLVRGIALDEVVRRRRGAAVTTPANAVQLAVATARALKELAAPPTTRPAFGDGDQARWPAGDSPARWIGLVLDGFPVCATFHRPDGPGPVPGPPGATPPGLPPGGSPPTEGDPPPGNGELEHRRHLTPYEERLLERHEGNGGSGGGAPPGSSTPPPPTPGPGASAPPGGGAGNTGGGSSGGGNSGGSPPGGSSGGGGGGGGRDSSSPTPGGGGPGGGGGGGGRFGN